MSSNLIRTDELSFSEIKQNLKTFLSAQSTLADYDFDGSVISVLLDVLAYNTHYNALYTNLAVNEMFLDSASKRSSLSSISKLLGYTPRSVASSTATISIVVSGTFASNTMTLSPGTTFSTEIDGEAFTFNLIEDVSATKATLDSTFSFPSIKIYEGESVSITYTQAAETRFVVPENNVDMNTLRVSVFNPGNSSTTIFTSATSIVDVGASDNVYFTKHIDDDLYEIFFGDGVFGTEVTAGSIVTMQYLVSKGKLANQASVFSYSGGADATKTYTVTTVFSSAGGADMEDKESIRFYAPLAYQAQGRAVTANDYAAVIAEAYPAVESITVWGGQDNIPPQFGKVFIAAKPFGRDNFTEDEKNEFRQGIIRQRGVVTVSPEFVDPRYYDVELVSNVYFDPSKTIMRAGEIETEVRNAITSFSENMSKFEVAFRHSKLTALIDAAEPAIVSSITTLRVRSLQTPILGVESDYTVNFRNPIAQSNTPTFYSTRFFLVGYADRGYMKNNGTDIEFYTEDSAGVPTFRKVVGSLDYNGIATIQDLNITSLYDDILEFVFYPNSYDVVPPNGVIIRLPAEKVTVNVIVDNLSQVKSARFDHIFSSSR